MFIYIPTYLLGLGLFWHIPYPCFQAFLHGYVIWKCISTYCLNEKKNSYSLLILAPMASRKPEPIMNPSIKIIECENNVTAGDTHYIIDGNISNNFSVLEKDGIKMLESEVGEHYMMLLVPPLNEHPRLVPSLNYASNYEKTLNSHIQICNIAPCCSVVCVAIYTTGKWVETILSKLQRLAII